MAYVFLRRAARRASFDVLSFLSADSQLISAMSKRAHIRRRIDSDDEDVEHQPAEEESTELNSNNASDPGYERRCCSRTRCIAIV